LLFAPDLGSSQFCCGCVVEKSRIEGVLVVGLGSRSLGRHCAQIGEILRAESDLVSASAESDIRGGGIVFGDRA